MKYCSICGKPMGWQGTITLNTATGTYTQAGTFGLLSDMCLGHTTYQVTFPSQLTPVPAREPVPQAFQDAFDKPLHP